ncbi:branched-chain amino acid transaminase [Halobacteriota archaeon]
MGELSNTRVLMNGRFVDWDDANVHVTTHALLYGTGVFEGIRGYYNEKSKQMYIVRLDDHVKRLLENMRLLRLSLSITADELGENIMELIRMNDFREDVYIRPAIYFGAGSVGLNPSGHDTDYFVFAMPFGKYLDTEKGISACVSSWRRITDCMLPPRGKIIGAYVNSVLAKQEAVAGGYDEAILLTKDDFVCEGSGENIFLVRNGKLITPPVYSDILEGITRASIIEMAGDLNYEVIERQITRTELCIADEVFLCGTGAEVTPVTSINGRLINDGKIGPITKDLKDKYFEIVRGKENRYSGWLMPIY